MTEFPLNDYTWQMNFTVHNLEKKDFGGYACAAVNALGRSEAVVRLQGNELTWYRRLLLIFSGRAHME